jgi:hypothetical protein
MSLKRFTCSKFQSEFECDFTSTEEFEKVVEIAERHEIDSHDFGDLPNLTELIINSLEDA